MKHVRIYLFVLLLCSPALAATNAIDPQVVDALERLAHTYENAQGWQLEVMSQFQSTYGTNSSYRTNNIEWAFQRPIKTRLVYDGSRSRLVTCDGVKTIVYEDNKHRYIVGDAPTSWHVRSDNEANNYVRSALSTSPLLLSMVSTNIPSYLLEGVLEAHCINTQTVNETACLQLQFRQEKFTWDLWIRTEKPHLIKRCTAYSNEPIGIEGRPKYTFRSEETWHHQELNPTWPDNFFVFTPPTNATLVETFKKPRKHKPKPPHPLLGKAAPSAIITRLDQSTVDLSTLYTNGPAVLDFWATWCGPCRAALPKLEKVAARWETNGVTVMAINSAEDPATISTYLDENPLTLNMARDDETLAELFEVESIPHTVIIDTNGIIQYVHTGFSFTLEDELSEILTQVMAGEPVAQNTLEDWQERVARGEVEEPPKVYKAQPIPSGTNAIIASDWRKQYADFYHHMFSDFYLNTRTTTNGEAQILAFLKTYEQEKAKFKDADLSSEEIVKQADALLEQGYDHPVIRYCRGIHLYDLRKKKQCIKSRNDLDTCIEAFNSSDYYSPWLTFQALSINLWNLWVTGMEDSPEDKKQKDLYFSLIPLVFSERIYSNAPCRMALWEGRRLHKQCRNKLFTDEKLGEILESGRSNIMPVVYHFTMARRAYKKGWDIRGTGLASTVKKEDWPRFHEKINEARKHTKASWEACPTPEAADLMIDIARCGRKEPNEWRKWFDRGVAIQMDHIPLYSSLEYTLYPRWGGSIRAMKKLADECLATQRYDTRVPHQYEEIIKDISFDSAKSTAIYCKPTIYSNLMTHYERLIADTDDDERIRHLRSLQAHVARFGEQYDDARRYLQQIHYQVTPASCRYYKCDRERLAHVVIANCSAFHDIFSKRIFPLEKEVNEDLGPALRELLATLDFTEDERKIMSQYADLVEMRADWWYGSGEMSLPNQNGLAPWTIIHGEWNIPQENVIASPHADELAIFLPIHLGNRFEITGDFELKPFSSRGRICFGRPFRQDYNYFYIELNRVQQRVRLKHYRKTYEKRSVPLTQLNSFRIRLINNKISVWINGEKVFDKSKVPSNWYSRDPSEDSIHLGFASKIKYFPDAEMALYNLHLKNLSEEEGDASAE